MFVFAEEELAEVPLCPSCFSSVAKSSSNMLVFVVRFVNFVVLVAIGLVEVVSAVILPSPPWTEFAARVSPRPLAVDSWLVACPNPRRPRSPQPMTAPVATDIPMTNAMNVRTSCSTLALTSKSTAQISPTVSVASGSFTPKRSLIYFSVVGSVSGNGMMSFQSLTLVNGTST